jgi:hypothetical protein
MQEKIDRFFDILKNDTSFDNAIMFLELLNITLERWT